MPDSDTTYIIYNMITLSVIRICHSNHSQQTMNKMSLCLKSQERICSRLDLTRILHCIKLLHIVISSDVTGGSGKSLIPVSDKEPATSDVRKIFEIFDPSTLGSLGSVPQYRIHATLLTYWAEPLPAGVIYGWSIRQY